jgi:ribosome-associated protein
MLADDLIPPDPPSAATFELAPGVFIVDSLVRLQYARGGGPGGQNVNKLNTKAELWVPIARLVGMTERAKARLTAMAGHRLTQAGDIHISSDTQRTQDANRSEVFQRLRELIVQAQHEPKRRRKTKPSRASKQRRLNSKKIRGQIKSNRRPPSE